MITKTDILEMCGKYSEGDLTELIDALTKERERKQNANIQKAWDKIIAAIKEYETLSGDDALCGQAVINVYNESMDEEIDEEIDYMIKLQPEPGKISFYQG